MLSVLLLMVLEDRSRLLISSAHKWTGLDVRKKLEDQLRLPVIVENISVTNAKFNINKLNANKKIIFVDTDDGIVAIWYNGGIMRGSEIAEIGHTTVLNNGPRCFCGGNGCLEVMCSPDRLSTLYKSLSNKPLPDNSKLAFYKLMYYVEKNDTAAIKVISECIDYLCIGIKNLIMIFNPEQIILNDGMYFKFDYIYNKVTSSLYISPLS